MTDPRPKRWVPEEVIVAGLDKLMERGLITTWRRDGYRWYVSGAAERGPYDAREIAAWVDGANEVGGWIDDLSG